MIIINICIVCVIQITHTDDFPAMGTRLVYIIDFVDAVCNVVAIYPVIVLKQATQ